MSSFHGAFRFGSAEYLLPIFRAVRWMVRFGEEKKCQFSHVTCFYMFEDISSNHVALFFYLKYMSGVGTEQFFLRKEPKPFFKIQ